MGWLIGSTLVSLVASFIAVKIFDYIFGEVTSGFVGIARLSLFVVTWTVITVHFGMHGFTKRVGQLRQVALRLLWRKAGVS